MVIDANHDIRMLQAGPYPYYLKQRILGNRGHLSNERSGQLIKALLNSHIIAILLGHLSKENNFEELAYETVKLELSDNEYASDVREFGLEVARRDRPGAFSQSEINNNELFFSQKYFLKKILLHIKRINYKTK